MTALLADASCDDAVEIAVLGYANRSEQATDPQAANWLQVRLRVSRGGRRWTAEGPFLLTWEVLDLSDWLRAVGTGQDAARSLEFTELYLDVELVDRTSDEVRLRVYFELDSRPPWSPAQNNEDFFVEVAMSPEAVGGAARSLRDALTSYPPRGAAAAAHTD